MPKTSGSTLQVDFSPEFPVEQKANRIFLIGGKTVLRMGIAELLRKHGLEVAEQHAFEESLGKYLVDEKEPSFDLILLVLTGGPFTAIHRIREALSQTRHSVPLVILSEETGRSEVYAALRIGAKACLDLDCDPKELVRAIRMAMENKVYLASDVAELLVNDMSASFEPSSKSQRLPSIELSRREVEIVQLLCEGLSSKEIARRLHLSAKTVENHRYNIYRKCQVDSIAALMRYAIKHGLVSI